MDQVRRLCAHYTLTPSGLMRDVVVTVGADGTILDLSSYPKPDSNHGVEFYSGILIPGMVNAHCHLELSYMKGLIPPPGCGFPGFGQAMAALRDSATRPQRIESASYHDAKMYAEGISAVADISNSGDTVYTKAASRVRYRTFVEIYGLGLTSKQRFEEVLRLFREERLTASITPHSMYSLNEAMLGESVEAGDGVYSVHFMESPGEAGLFRGEGQLRQWFEAAGYREDFTSLYTSPADRLVRTVPSGNRILPVHATFVDEEDIDLINRHFGQGVTWVICPRSNKYITGSMPPADLLRRKGCRIAVGTDSLASNYSLSVLEELKTLDGSLEEMLCWATVNGAVALGMEDYAGTLEPGKKPGVALIEKADLGRMRLTPESAARRLV